MMLILQTIVEAVVDTGSVIRAFLTPDVFKFKGTHLQPLHKRLELEVGLNLAGKQEAVQNSNPDVTSAGEGGMARKNI